MTDYRDSATRCYRDSAIDLVLDGMVEPMDMLKACLCYMSQDDILDMLEANEHNVIAVADSVGNYNFIQLYKQSLKEV